MSRKIKVPMVPSTILEFVYCLINNSGLCMSRKIEVPIVPSTILEFVYCLRNNSGLFLRLDHRGWGLH
jgi:hypothetical protein